MEAVKAAVFKHNTDVKELLQTNGKRMHASSSKTENNFSD
jgi:hypothetical protein